MDFFEQQDRARRRTTLLLVLFFIAVLGVIAAVNGVAWLAWTWIADAPALTARDWVRSEAALWVSGITLAIIVSGSVIRGLQIAHGGGGRVAILMGGRIVDPATSEPDQRELIRVVEEIAIASGVPVPCVYLLENEPGINAFAAGLHPANAAIVFTQGALDQLNRDELQGVVAHEFSHIANGDMRINAQLLALLAGITGIGEIGASFWRGMLLGSAHRRMSTGHRSRGNRGGGAQGMIVLLAVSLALILIGWIGVFVGRLIKAAVSRQREFLADAAAVQFTRNPDGIANALIRIAQHNRKSMLFARRAEEISHMGFARTVGSLTTLTATHPPIEDRLQAIGAKYAWRYRQAMKEHATPPPRDRERRRERATPEPASSNHPLDALGPVLDPLEAHLGVSAAALAVLVGGAGEQQLRWAQAILARIPEPVRDAIHQPKGATHTVLALLADTPEQQACWPDEATDDIARLRSALEATFGDDAGLAPHMRLPLLELALPALQSLESDAKEQLLAQVDAVIRANGRLSIFEFATRTLLRHSLYPQARTLAAGSTSLNSAIEAVARVLSLLCHAAGDAGASERETAFARAIGPLVPAGPEPPTLYPRDQCTLRAFNDALTQLDGLNPLDKRAVLIACADCIAGNGRVVPAEAELLRTIATVLGVPVPPIAHN